jgi:hypothetical protein
VIVQRLVGVTAAVSLAYAPAEMGEVTRTSRTLAVVADAGTASAKTASSKTNRP